LPDPWEDVALEEANLSRGMLWSPVGETL